MKGVTACLALLVLLAGPGPAEDYDKDGIPNLDDDCPTDPGNAANGGCPGDPPPDMGSPRPATPSLARLDGGRIVLERAIEFDSGKASLAKGNEALLDAIAGVVRDLPEGKAVVVRGHTDAVGRRLPNIKLSIRRAETVVAALVEREIPAARLSADGVGPDVPIAKNDTPAGRAKNRRVELVVRDAR